MLTRISLESVLRILPRMAAGHKVMAIIKFRHPTSSKNVLSHFMLWGVSIILKGILSIKVTIDFIADLQLKLFLVENDFQI